MDRTKTKDMKDFLLGNLRIFIIESKDLLNLDESVLSRKKATIHLGVRVEAHTCSEQLDHLAKTEAMDDCLP